MIEHRPIVTFVSHLILIFGVAIIAFPIWITFVASTHEAARMVQIPLPLLPGDQFFNNLKSTLFEGLEGAGAPPVGFMMLNSLVMALMIASGKIAISLLSAFAIVYFKFPFRMGFFWMIFITLMLPVEVRIFADIRSRGRPRMSASSASTWAVRRRSR